MNKLDKMINEFFENNAQLNYLKDNILSACEIIVNSYASGNKVLICGNGGSCADADHIVGELMKGFLLKRPLADDLKAKFKATYGETGEKIANLLQQGLPAIALNNHSALNTAFSNDVDPDLIYAQQVIGYINAGDVLIGISTSGNAANISNAVMAANIKGGKTIALTGKTGGDLKNLCNLSLIVNKDETYLIQEQHLIIYHFICAYVEASFFEN